MCKHELNKQTHYPISQLFGQSVYLYLDFKATITRTVYIVYCTSVFWCSVVVGITPS